jgi:mannose-6-phosphate isomerase-like protein (cupin superfamily)
MTPGPAVSAADVQADRTPGGASVRTLLDTGPAGSGFVRRLVNLPPGARFNGSAGSAGELWFVIEGSGGLEITGHPDLSLGRDRGLWIPPGAQFRVHADGPDELRIDAVTLPPGTAEPGGSPRRPAAIQSVPLTRDLRDCEVERTGDRQFRVLFGPGHGCAVATQFLGEIPAGRAPEHSHPYDEVVFILEGEGVLHLDGASHPLSAGTCVHLRPRHLHCLENTGSATMRVLGVFHPADSPAAKAETRP